MSKEICIFFKKEIIKDHIKKLLFRNISNGPNTLIENTLAGLKKNNLNYKLNPKSIAKNQICWVINDHKKLKELIELKKKNFFKLVVGPNISTLPSDYNHLLCSEYIDNIIVPSLWVKDLWLEVSSFDIKKKITIWPVGIDEEYWCPKQKIEKKYDFLIYIKNYFQNNIIENCIQYMKKKKINFKIIKYGQYKKRDYLKYLRESKVNIFFSKSESQSIAQFESWSTNVPVVIYEPKKKFMKQYKTVAKSGPYLNKLNGYQFNNILEFKDLINKLNKKTKNPRKLILNDYTTKKSIISLFKKI
jgi:hypothetical protein